MTDSCQCGCVDTVVEIICSTAPLLDKLPSFRAVLFKYYQNTKLTDILVVVERHHCCVQLYALSRICMLSADLPARRSRHAIRCLLPFACEIMRWSWISIYSLCRKAPPRTSVPTADSDPADLQCLATVPVRQWQRAPTSIRCLFAYLMLIRSQRKQTKMKLKQYVYICLTT